MTPIGDAVWSIRVSDAIDILRRAVEQSPENAPLRSHLGDLLAAAGRYEEALSEYQAALAREPSPDLQLACRGMVDEAPSRCAKIGDPNLRAFCDGVAAHDPKRCVIADGDAAHLCFALATHVPSNCRVVHGIDDRAFCVAVSHRDTILCGPIRR